MIAGSSPSFLQIRKNMIEENTFDWLFDDSQEPNTSKEYKFEVGQMVRILHNPHGIEGEFYKGQRGKIISVESSGECFVETCDSNTWLYSSKQLEPFKPRPLKVGDTVKIKSREWYNEYKDSNGTVRVYCSFTSSMAPLCGRVCTIEEIYEGKLGPYYFLDKGDGWKYSEEMLE